MDPGNDEPLNPGGGGTMSGIILECFSHAQRIHVIGLMYRSDYDHQLQFTVQVHVLL